MKIVTWNANGKFREKIRLFDPKNIDILVIQECEKTDESEDKYKAAGWDFHWVGENKHKGLGVFFSPETVCENLFWDITECQYFLPVKINETLTIVAVWAMGGRSKSVSYAGQITSFLDAYADSMGEIIFLGDFNSNAIWDKRHKVANHSKNDARLNEIGLKSLYHVCENEKLGQETQPTFFMYRKQDKPYHIDYVYLPEKYLKSALLNVGRSDKWLEHSDHMPLTFCL